MLPHHWPATWNTILILYPLFQPQDELPEGGLSPWQPPSSSEMSSRSQGCGAALAELLGRPGGVWVALTGVSCHPSGFQ